MNNTKKDYSCPLYRKLNTAGKSRKYNNEYIYFFFFFLDKFKTFNVRDKT